MQGPFLRKYGVETKINFTLYGTAGTELKVDAAHAAGDTTIMKDEGNEASTTNGFVDEGQGYSITLSATEMEAARIVVYVVDQGTKAWIDTAIVVETYGNASGQHAFDLDTASAAQTGDGYAVVAHADYGNAKLVRSTTPANALTVDANGEVTVPDGQKVDVNTIKTQTITCAAGVTVLASVGTADASTAQTGDSFAIVNSGTYGNSALKTLVDDIPTNAELASAVANVSVDEIQATALADLFNTDSGTTYGSAVSGSVVSEIADNAGGLSAGDIGDAVADEAYEGSVTLREAIRLILAVLTGKSSGGGTTTLVFRDIGDTKNRISCTVDANGNREDVGTRDGS